MPHRHRRQKPRELNAMMIALEISLAEPEIGLRSTEDMALFAAVQAADVVVRAPWQRTKSDRSFHPGPRR